MKECCCHLQVILWLVLHCNLNKPRSKSNPLRVPLHRQKSQNTWKFTLWLFLFSPDYEVFLGETETDLTDRRVISLLCGHQQRLQVLELLHHHRVGPSLPSELQGRSSACIVSSYSSFTHTGM